MPMTEEARQALIAERVKAHDPANQPTHRLPWRGGNEEFPVIAVNLDAVVLNPHSHRIRAQLESHPEAGLVKADPFSEEAQELIAAILRDTGENFDDLKQNLKDDGQLQFGVITRTGLLVNANRRTVALRDLGKTHIEVAVLPPDTTGSEINDLELTLQMQRDFWEEYTFTNRLLFVDELITELNHPVEEVARALNPAVSRDHRTMKKGKDEVEQDTRVLALLREIQRRSADSIPLTSFDEQEVALEELETRMQDGAAENPRAVAQLFEVRLLGILSDVPYRRLRQLDDEVLEDYVVPTLAENPLLGEILPSLAEPPPAEEEDGPEPGGLDVLDGDPLDGGGAEPSAAVRQVSGLVDLIATSYGEEQVTLPAEEGPRAEDRKAVIDNLNGALVEAAVEIEAYKRHDNRLLRPTKWVREAERKLKAAGDAYDEVSEEPQFDSAAFSEALDLARARLDALGDAAS